MIKEFFATLFKKADGTIAVVDNNIINIGVEFYYKKIAIETAINLISNTISLAEFKTFEKGKNVRKTNYYKWNIEPNPNQNANRFWREVIHNLIYNNEALIIMQDDNYYISTSFEKDERYFKESQYSKITFKDFQMKKTYKESEVFYLSLHSEKMKNLIDGLYSDYGKLIEYSKQTYKRSNARRGVLEIPTTYPQTVEAKEQLQKLMNEQFKTFFNAQNGAVLPLTNGVKYTDLTNMTYKNGSDSRDIKSLIDDVFDYVALAFQIPPQLLKGGVADSDKSFDNFMVFCVRPWIELIEKEINRKVYNQHGFLNKSYLKIDTSLIKQVGINELATAIDILTRTGANTLNDNLRMLGREEVSDELGNQRFITLNLSKIENLMKGSDENEKTEN